MVEAAATGLRERIRLAGVAITMVVIVVVPAIFLQQLTDEAQAATALVAHTHRVHAQAATVLADARALEASTLALTSGIDTPRIRARLQENLDALGPAMARLTELTRDNPAQLVRLGELKANIDQRMQLAHDVATARYGAGSQGERLMQRDAMEMSTRYPIQPIADALVAEENRLLEHRTDRAERLLARAHRLRAAAAIAQLVILGFIAWLWRRQLRGRIVADQARQRADMRAHSVLQTVREPIALLDDREHVLMHNAAFGELYGCDDAQGRRLADVGDGAWSDAPFLQRLHDVIKRNRELWDYEQVQRTADGSVRTMLVNARQMPLPDIADAVVLMTVNDITARKADEDDIRDLNVQLQGKIDQVSEVNQELEAFSYSVSHDLRAPLRHIAGFAEKLGQHLGDDADDKTRHYLDVMRKSAKRMSALIDDLLVYSRLGRSALRLQSVDMQSVVDETRSMLVSNALAETPEHRIEWRIAPLPIVVADENMMRQLWLNLLGNAVKYSAQSEPARIEVGYRRLDDGSHGFTVRDNGVGFDMAYADKLFGVFQRMHKASDFAGTGIGLASARRILLRHGGRIEADATPGVGATFSFVLPASLNSTPSTGSRPA